MLTKFIKKKTKTNQVKTTNIEEIQKIATEYALKENNDDNSIRTKNLDDVNKPENIVSLKPQTNKRSKKDTEDTLDSFIQKSEGSSFINDNHLALNECTDGMSDSRPFAVEHTSEEITDIEIRKMKIMNLAKKTVDIKYTPATAAIYLPGNLKTLSTLYKIISTVHTFNQKRGLSLIFLKYSESIEKLFKHRVEIDLLERLNFICNGTIEFVPLTIQDEGIKKRTFRILMKADFDIDIALFNYYCEIYQKWLLENEITGKICRFHPDFIQKEIDIPRKALYTAEELVVTQEDPKKIAKDKAESILERIKEKERLRKEQFVRECRASEGCRSRIDSIFEISGKKAMKLEEIVFKIGGFEARSNVLKSLGDFYEIRLVNGEEYVVKMK